MKLKKLQGYNVYRATKDTREATFRIWHDRVSRARNKAMANDTLWCKDGDRIHPKGKSS